MNIEDKINIESHKLSEAYYPFYIEKYPRNKFQVYNKYKQFFIKAAQLFCIRDNYDANKLITAFMMDGFKFPQQLPNEKVWETYLNYLPAIKEKKSKDIEIAENIINAAIVLKRYGSIEEYFKLTINKISLFKNSLQFNPLLLCFSEWFEDFYNKNYKSFEYDLDIEKYRKEVYNLENNSDKIINKIKEILKDDYYLFKEETMKELEKSGFVF